MCPVRLHCGAAGISPRVARTIGQGETNMRSRRISRLLIQMLALVLVPAFLCAQLQLGSYTLVPAAAPELRDPTHIQIGVQSQRMLAGVGGVAFDQIAAPSGNLQVQSLALEWSPAAPDGSRFAVMLNGSRHPVPLHNWQLIPTARFAESEFYSAVTLFGSLNDSAREKQVRDQKGDIINYHPALVDTLLGLRIFQLDVLILELSSTDLPRERDRYVLGAGENPPDTRANTSGWNGYMRHINDIESDLQQKFRSYLICDYNREIRFAVRDHELVLSGDPIFYCWRYKQDEPGFDAKALNEETVRNLDAQMAAARAADAGQFDPREFYIAALLKQAAEYQEKYHFYSAGTIVDMLKIKDDEARTSFLQRYGTDSLRRMTLDMRIRMAAFAVVYLREYSERLSARPEILRAINPQVWDAGVNLMRWSAFFRWVKRDYPDEWQRFLAGIRGIAVEPALKTPAIRMPAAAKRGESAAPNIYRLGNAR